MRRKILGAAGGTALTAALGVTLLANGTVSALGAPAPASGSSVVTRAGAPVAAGSTSTTGAAVTRVSPTAVRRVPLVVRKPAAAPKPVRKLTFSLLSGEDVNTNVTGFVTLADVLPSVATGVPGVPVTIEQSKGGKWVLMGDGVTDESGSVSLGFLAQTNMTLRATAKPTGKPVIRSKTFKFTARALVTWAARPSMKPLTFSDASYVFRVNPAPGAKGQLQWALKAEKPKWHQGKVAAANAEGVVQLGLRFAKPGTYLVRGASVASATNGVGTTSTIEVEVSAAG